MERKRLNDGQRALLARYIISNVTALPGQAVFAGSSLMEYFPVERFALEDSLPVAVYNRGVGGTVTLDLLDNIGVCITDLSPRILFINIGTNDLSIPGVSVDEIVGRYSDIIDIVRSRLPDCRVVMMAYYPVNIEVCSERMSSALRERTNEKLRLANDAVAGLAARKGAVFLDANGPITDGLGRLREEFSVDGMHITEEGYRAVWPIVRACLLDVWREFGGAAEGGTEP